MHSTESPQQTAQPNRGGLAPEDRQCRYEFSDGIHCRRWAIRGHDFCRKHGVWMATRVEGPIEVPLMEDPHSVQFVATQTARALSWGQIPPANGRGILHACRIVQTAFAQQLAEGKFRLKCHQLGLDPEQFLRTSASAEVPHVSPSLENVGQPEIRVPPVSAVGDMGERVSAPSNDPQPVILSEARSAASSVILSEARSEESKDLHLTADAPPLTASPLPPNPLDDLPPAPRPKSVCDPCIAALQQGADESLIDCDRCPAARSGNLRPPQLPDPRNPPESALPSAFLLSPDFGAGPKRPSFPNLKTNWDHAIERFAGQCAGERYPTRYPVQTDEEYAKELAAIRARPFDDILHARPASPPLPVPPPAPQPAPGLPSKTEDPAPG